MSNLLLIGVGGASGGGLPTTGLLAENGDFLIAENGDFLIQE